MPCAPPPVPMLPVLAEDAGVRFPGAHGSLLTSAPPAQAAGSAPLALKGGKQGTVRLIQEYVQNRSRNSRSKGASLTTPAVKAEDGAGGMGEPQAGLLSG